MIKAVKSIKEVVLTGHDLTLAELVAVSRYDAKIKWIFCMQKNQNKH